MFRKAFNECCRREGLGKLCVEYALTGSCECFSSKSAGKSPFSHDPPPAHTAGATALRLLLQEHRQQLHLQLQASEQSETTQEIKRLLSS